MSGRFDFSAFPVLHTRRLRLRQLVEADAAAVMTFRGDYEVTRYNIGAAYTDIEQAHGMIVGVQADYDAHYTLRWGLALPETDQIIGQIGYNHWDRHDERASIGFDLARAYWRRGLMSEALHAVIQFGFSDMGLNRIEADASALNVASQALLLKVGFVLEGRQREQYVEDGAYHDLLLFGLLKREYQPPTKGWSDALEP